AIAGFGAERRSLRHCLPPLPDPAFGRIRCASVAPRKLWQNAALAKGQCLLAIFRRLANRYGGFEQSAGYCGSFFTPMNARIVRRTGLFSSSSLTIVR